LVMEFLRSDDAALRFLTPLLFGGSIGMVWFVLSD
jgi:hypothetical protein